MIRVALDARRQRDNGVARVTRLIATALPSSSFELVMLGPRDQIHEQFPEIETVEYSAPLLSDEDLYGLEPLLLRLGIECFIAPQFYNSPWTSCPQVRLLHDTFPLKSGAHLTSLPDVQSSFGVERVGRVSSALLGERGVHPDDLPAQLYRAYYDLSVAHASRLLTVSEQSRTDLLAIYPEAAPKLAVLPMSPDPRLIGGASVRSGHRHIDALHVSKFEPRKNQLLLIEAWRLLRERRPDFRAAIVGSPSALFPEYTRAVIEMIDRSVEEGWLAWYEGIDDVQLGELYSNSTIVCVPSAAEGFGLPALEAMANGCVVVTLRGTAVEEFGRDHIIYSEESSEALCAAHQELLSDSSIVLAQRRKALEHAGMFTIDRTSAVLTQSVWSALSDEPS